MARLDNRPDKPGAPGFRIRTLTAFIAVDEEDNSEGVVACTNPVTGMTEPLIGADDARIMQYRPLAERFVKATGTPITLVRFTVREDVETLR